LDGLPELHITPASIARAAAEARPPLARTRLQSWAQHQLTGARAARHAARRVRRLTRSAEHAVKSDDPRAITRAFAKLDDAEQKLRASVVASPFVDAYSWTAVDSIMQDNDAGQGDSLQCASRAVATEARVAEAIETCTRDLEQKLEQLVQSFGAPAP
jgi:hypothetical protein